MNVNEALGVMLTPVYERLGRNGETIEQFTDLFLESGGAIQVQLPKIIQDRLENPEEQTNEELPAESHFTFDPNAE